MDYVIIGSGVAGVSAAKEILAADGQANITLISKEKQPFYYRPRLIECLSGEKSVSDIIIHDRDWFVEQGIDLHLDEAVTEVEPEAKQVITEQESYSYDRLLLATGASCFVPPIPGRDKENVFTLRWAEDAGRIYKQAQSSSRAVVVGGRRRDQCRGQQLPSSLDTNSLLSTVGATRILETDSTSQVLYSARKFPQYYKKPR